MRAGSLVTDTGCLFADTGYWRAALIIIAAVFLIMLLITHLGKAARLGRGAEVAFSRALQLLHEADNANRNVRPLPLSLAKVQVLRQFTMTREGTKSISLTGKTGKTPG